MAVIIAFDIGGTRIKSGLVVDGQIVQTDVTDVADNRLLRPILIEMEKTIQHYLANYKSNESLAGIGIALPCFVDSKNKKILSHYVKYTDAPEIDLNQWAMDRWGVPIAILNDAKAALLGEWQYGAGQAYQNLVMLTFGTGIGSGVLIEGNLLNGKDYIAGNLAGHSIIDYDGEKCNCGNVGCLEAIASGWSIEDKVRRAAIAMGAKIADNQKIDFQYLFEQSKQGNTFYEKIIEDCLKAWGRAIINMILAYNPDAIICGGGIMNSYELIFPYFKKIINQHGWIGASFVDLKRAEQPEFAAILGLYSTFTTLSKVE